MEIILANPRGFCAGVERAIDIVERALEAFGAPIYVRHEVVHNRFVIERLRAMGAVFVEELSEVPDGATVIFSAHGVSRAVVEEARGRGLTVFDATCPLVSKVHIEAERHYAEGRHILLVGHAGHPEVIGTMGQLPPGAVTLIETLADAEALEPDEPKQLAFITQTTLSVDDTAEIVAVLQRRFPSIATPHKEDICYATTNRQAAVKAIASRVERMIVVGAPNSSNSLRLVEVASRAGCPDSMLIQRASDIDWSRFQGISTLGITAGASAPEVLVDEIIAAFRERFDVVIEEVVTKVERIAFNVPRELRGKAAAPDRADLG